jgi:rubrerythrin
MQGNPDIDILMIPTSKAIKKHVKDRDAFTEIYNRAYEAVMISMEVKDAENAQLEAERNKLAEAVGLMTTLKPTMVVDSAHPVEMALEVSEYITQLTSENEKLTLENRSLNYQLNASIVLKISAIRSYTDAHEQMVIGLKSELKDWKADAERLAKHHLSITKANLFHCSYCGYITTDDDGIMVHQDTCPITLHRELVAKYGGENNGS